ncbi:hypothetical protein ACFC1T_09375 [Kitasatospora sp. NPDC056076]|uniref:hypothetical protein n=1 Tax=Kitasatospora sp. NPDC056076 TaxID=3345703 RepID=UPI0035D6DD94
MTITQEQLDGAYRERVYLCAYLTRFYPSALQPSEDEDPNWKLLRIYIGRRWLFWHISINDLDLLGHVPDAEENDPDNIWDGHTTEEKYLHLLEHASNWQRTQPGCAPGSTDEVLPASVLEMCESHCYTSTACDHSIRVLGRFGFNRFAAVRSWLCGRCRHTCKFCNALCQHSCHPWNAKAEAS